MHALRAVALALSVFAQQPHASAIGARNPAFARDGRLAVSARGDLWVVSPSGRWTRVTSGPSWDREPAWTADGAAIVFSSDRAGNFDLWRIAIRGDTAASAPERLTTSGRADEEPTVAPNGRIYFVRGRLADAELWSRDTTGRESRVTSNHVTERWPAVSPDGRRLAYVSNSLAGAALVVRDLESGKETTVVSSMAAERPAWAPAGDRLTFTRSGAHPGVFVTPLDGRYANVISVRYAESAWTPDGRTIALADLPPVEYVGYNGDPDRTGDREENLLAVPTGELLTVPAPTPPDAGAIAATGAPATPREQINADAFDQLWSRTQRLYYSSADAAGRRAAWEQVAKTYRPRAIAARNDDELKAVLHEMLRGHPSYREPARGRAAVSSANPVATAAGLAMLRQGGNVVDAAVAISFALAVVEPDASGPGGYGQMLVYQRGMDRPRVIEFMSRVPEHAGLDNTSILRNGRLPDDGPVLVNVPGTVAAMYLAWQQFGSHKLPWADLLAPAIQAAREGYIVSDGLATTLATEREHFLKYPGSRALFFRGDEPLVAGDTLKNPDLAWTLAQIAAGGAKAFYDGEIARKLVGDLHAHGSPMVLSDMARYYAAEREPVSSTYRGYTLFSSAPPVAGGAELASQLNLLEQFPHPKPYQDDAATLHAMITAWQLVPSTRGRIADPGLWSANTVPFVSKDTARARWRCYDPGKALAPAALRGDTLTCARPGQRTVLAPLAVPPVCEAHGYGADQAASCRAAGTTAFTVADADGNLVATTQTLGTWGGNFYVTPGLGFLYNDKLASYPSDSAAYGARLPFARHGSTIAPTIVFKGTGTHRRPVMAVGAAGNAWITSAVYQTLVGMIDQGLDPQAALELPRFLVGGFGGSRREASADDSVRAASVQLEDGFSPKVIERLEALGYRPQIISLMGELRMGYGAAVKIENGHVLAGADPRRNGAAAALP